VSIGIKPYDKNTAEAESDGEDGTEERISLIPLDEMTSALESAEEMASKSEAEIIEMGWKLVHSSDVFTLYKRRARKDGPVEYMMTGNLEDISPRTWLFSQVDKACREGWDKTMKDMSEDENVNPSIVQGDESCEDVLYYRTKWPWPLKDRDYTLARRCYEFKDRNALVFISKSVDRSEEYPENKGVIRVDNYWCHSTFIAHPRKAAVSDSEEKPAEIAAPTEAPADASVGENNGMHVAEPSIEGSTPEALPGIPEDNQLNGDEPTLPQSMQTHTNGSPGVSKLRGVFGGSTAARKPTRRRGIFGRSQAAAATTTSVNMANNEVASSTTLEKRADIAEASAVHTQTSESHLASSIDTCARTVVKAEEVSMAEGISEPSAVAMEPLVDKPGMRFVTIFCDDQRVPLPPRLVDLLSKVIQK
jgi:hypothetical protein